MTWEEMLENGQWSPATLTAEFTEEAVTIIQVPSFQLPPVTILLLAATATSVFASLYF